MSACHSFSNFFGLNQLNQELNAKARLLDLVFSTDDGIVRRAVDLLVPEDSHHPALMLTISGCSKRNNCLPIKTGGELNFRKANFQLLYQKISKLEFSSLESFTNVDEAVESFYNMLYNIFSGCVPRKLQSSRQYPVWFNKEIISTLKLKHKLWTRFKKDGSLNSYENFKTIRLKVKTMIEKAYKTYIQNTVEDIKINPKNFWNFVKQKNRQCNSIPSVMRYGDSEMVSPNDIVNAFSDYFSKSFLDNSCNTSPAHIHQTNNVSNTLHVSEVSERKVTKAIKHLKVSPTAGPDSIPSFLMKDCATILCKPLTIIFNLILKTSTYSQKWKLSRVTPIFKKGSRNDVTKYRPITIIDNFAKVFEILLHSLIYDHVSTLLSCRQHGFVKGRSTVTNLFLMTQFVSECVDRQSQVDCIYFDFSKAFDRMNHEILLQKIDAFGFSDPLIQLFSSYLDNRYQYVQCYGHKKIPV